MSQRKGDSSHDKNVTKRFRSEDVVNEYCGYKLTLDDPNPIDTLSSEVSPFKFFQDYITKRKPVILDFFPSFPNNEKSDSHIKNDQSWKVNPSTLRSVAGDEFVQVEKRQHSKESFGQRRTKSRQLKMKISQFLDCLCGYDGADPELYYLSTQQSEYDSSTSNTSDSLQTPCRQLAHENFIPSHLPIAGSMNLHSCNLWMGASRIGSSSGLHHDFHDNFYVLLKGTKHFRLFSPDSALCMHTKGSIHKIYSNGMISYVGSETRLDGFPLASLDTDGKHPNESHSDILDCNDSRMTEEVSDEEECVIGKGFDYESSEDEEGGGGEGIDKERRTFLPDHDEYGDVEHDDYDALESNNDQSHEEDEEENLDPPADSFSKIPISLLNDTGKLAQVFPDFASCPTCEIELRAGQCLYLPTGWFHEVVSLSERNEVHIAVNFWYFPPDDLASFDTPYAGDNFLKVNN